MTFAVRTRLFHLPDTYSSSFSASSQTNGQATLLPHMRTADRTTSQSPEFRTYSNGTPTATPEMSEASNSSSSDPATPLAHETISQNAALARRKHALKVELRDKISELAEHYGYDKASDAVQDWCGGQNRTEIAARYKMNASEHLPEIKYPQLSAEDATFYSDVYNSLG
jgi:hypothetical protein